MKGVKYPFASVYVEPPEELSNRLIDWAKERLTDDDIYVKSGSPAFGREDEMHITLLYGLENPTLKSVEPIFKDTQRITVGLGKTNIFHKEHFDVVYVEILYSDHLHEYNTKLKTLPHLDKHKVYIPHLTLGYVKKGCSSKFRYLPFFQKEYFWSHHVTLSTKDGTKQKIFFGQP